jgi:hypothetical protein
LDSIEVDLVDLVLFLQQSDSKILLALLALFRPEVQPVQSGLVSLEVLVLQLALEDPVDLEVLYHQYLL